jgi:hypothetical protein
MPNFSVLIFERNDFYIPRLASDGQPFGSSGCLTDKRNGEVASSTFFELFLILPLKHHRHHHLAY